jgi:hypothetical protein
VSSGILRQASPQRGDSFQQNAESQISTSILETQQQVNGQRELPRSDVAKPDCSRVGLSQSETTSSSGKPYIKAAGELTFSPHTHSDLCREIVSNHANQLTRHDGQAQQPARQESSRSSRSQREIAERSRIATSVADPMTSYPPTCNHHQSHAIIRGRALPVCLRCSDHKASFHASSCSTDQTSYEDAKIAVVARPLLHTMQGFPFDLRCSGFEASRLLRLPLEAEEVEQMRGGFGQRQLTLSRSNAQRLGTRRVGGG